MNKPEFPIPRIIREDFLPEQDPLMKYRIKKVTGKSGYERYYPQVKILWLFWVNLFGEVGWYDSYEEANKSLIREITPEKVEYLEVDLTAGW